MIALKSVIQQPANKLYATDHWKMTSICCAAIRIHMPPADRGQLQDLLKHVDYFAMFCFVFRPFFQLHRGISGRARKGCSSGHLLRSSQHFGASTQCLGLCDAPTAGVPSRSDWGPFARSDWLNELELKSKVASLLWS